MKFNKNYYFVIFFNLIIGLLSEDILQKSESKETNNDYIIFNSSSFSIGNDMYFEIKSKSDCDDYLYYQYYDNVSSIDYNSELYYKTKSTTSSSTKVNGKIKSLNLYFTITKKENELDGLKGDYLFLNFDCDDSVEFANSEKSGISKNTAIILPIVAGVILLFIACFLIIRYYRKRRMRGVVYEERENYPYQYNIYPNQGIPYPNQGIPYPNQGIPYPYPNSSGMPIPQQNGNSTFIYQNNPNIIMNNPNNPNIGEKVKRKKGAGSKKIKIADKGMISGPQSASNSDALQKFEKPKV